MSEIAAVALVHMPYSALERPSLALGLLKASLAQAGIPARVAYANLPFAEVIGLPVYQAISSRGDCAELLGEWTFAGAAFPDFQPDHNAYLTAALGGSYTEASYRQCLPSQDLQETLWAVRRQATPFVDGLARAILRDSPRIVGCTSSVQQHCAALALLRRIRELDGSVITLLGGANCEGPMGLATRRAFPWVDYVVSGEADLLLPDLVRLLLARGREVVPSELPLGVIGPAHEESPTPRHPGRALVADLDACPTPSYDDYFAALAASSFAGRIRPGLLIETSRGCWWGQKQRCAFCGLNGGGIGYRQKTPGRILAELAALSTRHGLCRFEAADNVLALEQIQAVLPRLADAGAPYSIFYETRANLTYQQMALMARAGVRWIQPGIESLHSRVLKLLHKGSTATQGIQLLRWALELGIRVSWNLLFGAPGEEDAWYAEMAAWLPHIAHLESPKNMVRIRFDRFSPYHERPESYGLRLAPKRAYSFIYPLPPQELAELACFFEDSQDASRGSLQRPGLEAVRQRVVEWNSLFWSSDGPVPVLSTVEQGERTVVCDTRPHAQAALCVLEGPTRRVLSLCDRPQTRQGLARALSAESGAEEVEDAVDELVEAGFLLPLDGRLISLTVRGLGPDLPKLEEFPGGYY